MNSRERYELVMDGWMPPEVADVAVRAQKAHAEFLNRMNQDVAWLGEQLRLLCQPHPDQAAIDAESAALLRQGLAEFVCPECGVRTAIHRCPKCDWDGDYEIDA